MLRVFPFRLSGLSRTADRVTEQAVRRLTGHNYQVAKAYYFRKLRREDNRYDAPPLLIHQMGKVGSSTVTKSLKAAKINRHIYHTHFLTPALIESYEQKRKSYLSTEKEGDLKHIWQYEYLHTLIKQGLNGKKWPVVTLVRDPVARNLSDFFEHIEVVASDSERWWQLRSIEYEYEITIEDNDLTGLIEIFFEKYDHDTPMRFFDREIKDIFKVDLLAGDFPSEKGYKVYHGTEADVLLLKLEHLNACFSAAFKEFLNIDDLPLINANVSTNKDFGDLYQRFQDRISFPETYIDKMYASKVAQHFYSEAELARFKARWSGKGAG